MDHRFEALMACCALCGMAPAGAADPLNIKFSGRGLKVRGKLAARQAIQILRDELRLRGPAPLDLPVDPQCLPAPRGGSEAAGGRAALFSPGRFV